MIFVNFLEKIMKNHKKQGKFSMDACLYLNSKSMDACSLNPVDVDEPKTYIFHSKKISKTFLVDFFR